MRLVAVFSGGKQNLQSFFRQPKEYAAVEQCVPFFESAVLQSSLKLRFDNGFLVPNNSPAMLSILDFVRPASSARLNLPPHVTVDAKQGEQI
jgi:hypothetical protein